MLHALLVLAAEEAESSKTAFYLLGGLLAAWAVVLAAVGLTRPSFPATTTAARGVMALTAVLTVGATAAAVITG